MNFRRLLKMLETETDKEKIAEVMRKINLVITKKVLSGWAALVI